MLYAVYNIDKDRARGPVANADHLNDCWVKNSPRLNYGLQEYWSIVDAGAE